MSLSAAKATHGLVATFTAAAPSVSWTERIGGVPESVSLPLATHGYEISALIGGSGYTFQLDVGTGQASVTGAGAAASGTLTLSGNAVADETVTIGAKTYTWKASVSTTVNQVKIGSTASESLDNLIAAINAGAGSGTVYGSATTANAAGTAAAGAGDTLVFTAGSVGTASNAVATTETMTAGSWGAATLTGGVNASVITSGGDGKDSEGVTFPSQFFTDGVRIKCTAGSIQISSGSALDVLIGEGGVFLICDPSGFTSFNADPIVITGQSMDATVTIEVLSHISV